MTLFDGTSKSIPLQEYPTRTTFRRVSFTNSLADLAFLPSTRQTGTARLVFKAERSSVIDQILITSFNQSPNPSTGTLSYQVILVRSGDPLGTIPLISKSSITPAEQLLIDQRNIITMAIGPDEGSSTKDIQVTENVMNPGDMLFVRASGGAYTLMVEFAIRDQIA